MKPLLIILSLALFNCSAEQKPTEKQYCLVLQDIIEMPMFNKQFYLSDHPGKDFIISDINRVFAQCHLDSVQSRRVIISDSLYSKSSMRKNSSIVTVALGYKFEDRLISFGFWCPGNGGALTIHYEIKNNELNLLGYNMGSY